MANRNNKIIGSFVFRNEGDGCLTSKYQHAASTNGPYTESCKQIGFSQTTPTDRFAGTYRTAWLQEPNNNTETAELLIERTQGNIYHLFWYVTPFIDAAHCIFEGTGMLFQDLLVGAYWD